MPFITSGETPGGCTSERACKEYCNDDAHFSECIDFAVKAGLISSEEAAEARKVGGKGPGDCNSKKECKEYCKDSAHTQECITFAVEHGLMTQEEAEMVAKTGFGPGPGGCEGKEECDTFCNDQENMITCITFAKEKGLIDAEEADLVIAAGGTDRATFDAFCNQNDANWERCTRLWVSKGYMSQDEADKSILYRQTPKPGNCQSEL